MALVLAFPLLSNPNAVCAAADGEPSWITVEGDHVRIVSDLSDSRLLEDLAAKFDAAVPQWLSFWAVPNPHAGDFKIDAYVMRDVEAFRSAGKIPRAVPRFKFGFASPSVVWVRSQSDEYYTRHLLLHEGVHALALTLFGGGGPSWYMEGTAELLATHRESGTNLESNHDLLLAQQATPFRINQIPRSREEAPQWGRMRIIRERRAAGQLPSLRSVLQLPMNLNGEVDAYTWSWAAAMMMTRYPDTRDAYLQLAKRGGDQSPAFTAEFLRQVQKQWPLMRARWKLLLHDLEFGFDWQQASVALSTEDPRYDGRPLTINVDATRGWQSAGAWFPKRTRLFVDASGACRIAKMPDETTWQSTPSGITARFHRGAPLGQLQVCVLPIAEERSDSLPPLNVLPVTGEALLIQQPAWLLFRINDRFGTTGEHSRGDNQGGYRVTIAAG